MAKSKALIIHKSKLVQIVLKGQTVENTKQLAKLKI